MDEVLHTFERHFGRPAEAAVRAPGRVELLGNHTDYNQGLVMALAIDRCITLAGARRQDGQVELISTAFPEPARFPVDTLVRDPASPWADYVKGLLLQLRERGVGFGGFSAAIHSTIPLGAGLSSSAALLVATGLLMRKLHPFTLTTAGTNGRTILSPDAPPPLTDAERLALAKVCQAAENRFVGVNCGLLDPISSLFGRAHQVVRIDCRSLTVDWSPLPADLEVVVCHSGVRHALVGGEYNERRARCESAARTLGVEALRAINLAGLEAGRPRLDTRDYACALHVVGENDRVQRGAVALERGDMAAFGRLLGASHASSRDHFRNSCPELDLLVELAGQHPGCLGARLTGGGFGGATLNLVHADQATAFQQQIARDYLDRTGRTLQSWVCEVVDGAG